ncbi:universal stress protein [Halobacteriales archaeon QH_10_70_21]|nr:MAG: universal stress protein [Halobacteriales archaeon QH_10_70_21]
MYDRIPVPTDGSTGSAHVAMQAFDLADRYGATVHVLHVVDGSLRSVLGTDSATEALHEPGRRAVETLEELARSDDLETVPALREGDCAGDVDADLIVMGTHGRSGIERRLIGSVAETVVRHAERPVMTVRLPETGETVEERARRPTSSPRRSPGRAATPRSTPSSDSATSGSSTPRPTAPR